MTKPNKLLAAGTYRLTMDLPALFPDKRKSRDWRAKPMKAGMLFAVEPDLDVRAMNVWLLQGYAFMNVSTTSRPTPEKQAFFEALEPVKQETPGQWLLREHTEHFASEILDRLVADGTLTLEEVKAAAARVLAAEE